MKDKIFEGLPTESLTTLVSPPSASPGSLFQKSLRLNNVADYAGRLRNNSDTKSLRPRPMVFWSHIGHLVSPNRSWCTNIPTEAEHRRLPPTLLFRS